MTVDDILKLKQEGFTADEIATLSGSITTPAPPPEDPAEDPAAAYSKTIADMANRMAEMQLTIKQMQESTSGKIQEGLQDLEKKLFYGNTNAMVGEMPPESSTESLADSYLARIVNPFTGEEMKANAR